MIPPARVMMYSQDSYGLGHLRRLTNLANELVRRRADLCVLLVVDSQVAPFFDLGPRVDFVKLPSLLKKEAGVFEPCRLLASYESVRRMRANLICEVVRGFRPDVFLVDHMPGGANRELIPALETIQSEGICTRMVLGLRDIIDHPDVTRRVWEREMVYDTIKRFYDWVVVYGSGELFPTAERYGLEAALQERVQYCGYVCNHDAVKSPERIRAKLRLGSEPLVVVTGGGGSDAFRLMRTYLDARALLDPVHAPATLMVTGPFMRDTEWHALREHARALKVQVHRSIGDTLSHVNAANLVVSMAGYNTLSEILRFGKRAIVVPRAGPSAEQTMRARMFADRGLIRMLHPAELSADRLAALLHEELSGGGVRHASLGIGLHGTQHVTRTLLDFAAGPRSRRAAAEQTATAVSVQPDALSWSDRDTGAALATKQAHGAV